MAVYDRLHDQNAESQEKLLPSGGEDQINGMSSLPYRKKSSTRWLHIMHGLIEAVLIILVVCLLVERDEFPRVCQVNFTPAREAIQYEIRKFNAGYLPGEKSKYQLACPDCKPTDEIDAAWSELYGDLMWSKIPRAQAAQLRNLTINIPGNTDHYLIGLDVFHQLHCLDNVRKGLWPERYNPEDHMGGQGMSLLSAKHLDHCLDQIRQSIMCQSDLSTNWLSWNEDAGANMAARDVEHSCRSFESVVEWAREHRQEPFDLSIRLEDPLKAELA